MTIHSEVVQDIWVEFGKDYILSISSYHQQILHEVTHLFLDLMDYFMG